MTPHHPWRAFAGMTDWTLRWEQLPGDLMGLTDWSTRTVTLTTGLSEAERRCTIAHETRHIERGPFPRHLEAAEEAEVDRLTARLLLPDVRRLGAVMAAAPDVAAAASELWVDELVLEARLRALHPSERGWLRQHLARRGKP